MTSIPQNYKPHSIRNIIIALLNDFSNIDVDIVDPNTNELIKTIPSVPITFGPLEKYTYLRDRLENTTYDTYYQSLPKMGLNWTSINYNGERATGVQEIRTFYNKNLGISDIDGFIKDVNPVPYDIGFDLDIRTNSIGQFTQIIEKILPNFNPHRHIRIKEFSFLNIERDIKVKNDGLSQNFLLDQDETNRREVHGIMALTVEAFLYTQLSNEGIIKTIKTNIFPGHISDEYSALSSFHLSGWDSSASFPLSTLSYTYSGTSSGSDNEYDYFVNKF
jgi:hypothetical protein